jgi:uncharacterized protein YciI
MFIVLLEFSENRDQASQFMEGHNEWLKRGFADGIFLVAGGFQPGPGGGIVAHDCSLTDIEDRVNDDPFVANRVVRAQIIEITPSLTDERLRFLID